MDQVSNPMKFGSSPTPSRRYSSFQAQPSLFYTSPFYMGKAPAIYLAQPNGLGLEPA